MAHTPPWQRLCNCRCPLHHGEPRTTYDERGCACLITCDTQPTTLLAEQWNGHRLREIHVRLQHVPAITTGQWDWENTGEVDTRSEFYDHGVIIEHLVRASDRLLRQHID